jgi:hypothetical protein
MLTASCRVCGKMKDPSEYAMTECRDCKTVGDEAAQGFAAENPNAAESDILYARRQALNQRAHTAHKNFTDPRAFSAARGMLPIPPPDRRGTPGA